MSPHYLIKTEVLVRLRQNIDEESRRAKRFASFEYDNGHELNSFFITASTWLDTIIVRKLDHIVANREEKEKMKRLRHFLS